MKRVKSKDREQSANFGFPSSLRSASYQPPGIPKVALPDDAAIILVKRGGLGDFILMTPALSALRARYPRARIDFVVSSNKAKDLLQHFNILDDIISMPNELFKSDPTANVSRRVSQMLELRHRLKGRHYDVAVCFNHLSPEEVPFFSAIVIATGARYRVGLDCGTADGFFDIGVPDPGFGARHEAEYQTALVKALDAAVVDPQPWAPINEEWRRRARAYLANWADGKSTRPLIGMHPGSFHAYPMRRWMPERFAAAADQLYSEFGGRLLLLGGPEEIELRNHVRAELRSGVPCEILSGNDDLLLTAAIIGECDLFIGNDSGLMHLAAAVNTPTIGIFGMSNPCAWAPFMPAAPSRARTVYRDLACRPCNSVGLHGGDQRGCDTRDCLTGLSVEEVVAVARDVLTASTAQETGTITEEADRGEKLDNFRGGQVPLR